MNKIKNESMNKIKNEMMKLSQLCLPGLGLAYAGSNREDVLSLLLPVLSNAKSSMEAIGVAAMACGLVAVGSCNGDVTSALLQTLMEKSEVELKDTFARFLPLGLGLTYLGKQEAVEAVVLALEVLTEPFKVKKRRKKRQRYCLLDAYRWCH